MKDLLESVLLEEQLTPAQRTSFGAALEQDPSLGTALRHWLAVRAHLKDGLDSAMPDRRLFALHVLARSGYGDALSEEERAEVSASAGMMERAVEACPALDDVAGRIEEDTAVFMECWEQPVRVVRFAPRVWRMAAGIALLVGFAAVFGLLRGQEDVLTFAAADGETELVVLPDGSTAHLVGEARVSYDAEDFDRQVSFSGNALFDVAHDEDPFTIDTPGAVTTVLGTRFGIRAISGDTEVTLERGRVSLAAANAPDAPVMLAPGQMSRVEAGDLPSEPVAVDLVQALDWTGYLFFDATPMEEVVRILEARFGVDIAVTEALRLEEVTGSFEPSDTPGDILTVLSQVLGASVEGSEAAGFTIR